MAIKARIQLKYDTEENWNKAGPKENSRGFIPLNGEVIIYSPDDTRRFCRLKIGDGSTNVVDLPFVPYGDEVEIHTTEYWNSQSNYIPYAGRMCIYSDRSSLKIGDGTTYLIDLPFIDDAFVQHSEDANIHVSAADRTNWNNKLNCVDSVENEMLILNRS